MSYSCTSKTPGIPPKKRRREMIFCGHCDRQVPESTCYHHYREFYNPVSKMHCKQSTSTSMQSESQSTTTPNVFASMSTSPTLYSDKRLLMYTSDHTDNNLIVGETFGLENNSSEVGSDSESTTSNHIPFMDSEVFKLYRLKPGSEYYAKASMQSCDAS